MRVLATFPGRYGDLIWALPSVRALAESLDQPVDLAIAGEFEGLVPLLEYQPYLGTIYALHLWTLTPPEEWKAPLPTFMLRKYDQIIHLGYRGWPALDLAHETERVLQEQKWGKVPAINLTRPWITDLPPRPTDGCAREIAVGFTEAWFELKLGLVNAAIDHLTSDYTVLTIPGSRWLTEAWGIDRLPCDWITAAQQIRDADLFLGDCSALHVLAVALGKPALIVEPMEARWNPIFYPLGMDGPQVTVVKGNDGRPTFDAREVQVAIRRRLA